MAKYSYEFKKQLVLEYLNNHGGYTFLSQKHGLPNHSQLKKWVAAYKTFGDDGLKRSRSRKQYSMEVSEKSKHVGGFTLFSRNFGNYNQDIKLKVSFRDK